MNQTDEHSPPMGPAIPAPPRLEWKNERPSVPGMYLRSNPPILAIVIQWIVDPKAFNPTDTRGLCMQHHEGGLVPFEKIPERFWWYGPVPNPPWKQKLIDAVPDIIDRIDNDPIVQ